jgi:hypothetical protein
MQTRRRFLERLGLGAGACVLSPVLDTLIAEAQGQPVVRRRALFVVVGNGIRYDNFIPPELRQGDALESTSFTWPAMLKSLEAHRSRALLIDGLANQTRNLYGHTGGFGALSCMEPQGIGAEKGGPPAGPTIDQYLAARLPQTRLRSVLYGITQNPRGPTTSSVFGSAAGKPEPHMLSPRLLFNTLFEGLVATDANDKRPLKRRVVLDALRGDLKRAQAALAGPERRKLDDYVAALEEMEQRQASDPDLSCRPTMPPAGPVEDWKYGPTRPAEDILSGMHEMGSAALACGMTNVVGVSFGTGHSHENFPRLYKLASQVPQQHWDGKPGYIDGSLHNNVSQPHQMAVIHDFNAGLIARTVEV